MLSRLTVGEVSEPERLPCLGHPSQIQESIDKFNGVQNLSKSDAFVGPSVLPATYALPSNHFHLLIRSRFVSPPLLLKAAIAGKVKLDFLHSQEVSLSQVLCMTLHLATTSMVGCGFMVRDEVPTGSKSVSK